MKILWWVTYKVPGISLSKQNRSGPYICKKVADEVAKDLIMHTKLKNIKVKRGEF